MRAKVDRVRLKAKRLVERYQLWLASWMRRGVDREKAHQLSLREMGVHWREFARAERLAAG